jgi:hypothetical protein
MKAAALLLALAAGSGDIDAGAGRWKVEFKLSLAQKDGRWSFHVDGTTDLPAGTQLSARVFVLDVRSDAFQGPLEDDGEPLVGRDDAFQPAEHTFKVGGAELHEKVHTFRRKPYSITYRAKLSYRPEEQTDALTLKVGDETFVHQADLRVGTDADYARELRERIREMGQDLLRLEKMAFELGEWIGRARKEPAAWSAWKDPMAGAVSELQLANLQRYGIWAVWPEYQGRFRIDGLSGFLERMMEALDDPKADEKKIRSWMAGFVESLDDAYTVIGFEPPLDAQKAGPVLAAYETAVKPLLEGRMDPKARADGISALFDLLRLLRSRPRGYTYVNALSLRLSQILGLLDRKAPASELGEALNEHAAALQEFRAFAGLR